MMMDIQSCIAIIYLLYRMKIYIYNNSYNINNHIYKYILRSIFASYYGIQDNTTSEQKVIKGTIDDSDFLSDTYIHTSLCILLLFIILGLTILVYDANK